MYSSLLRIVRQGIRGMRWPVEVILDMLSSEMSIVDILQNHPELEKEDIIASLLVFDKNQRCYVQINLKKWLLLFKISVMLPSRLTILQILLGQVLLQGQNLVPNPGFEHHLKPLQWLQIATFVNHSKLSQTVSGWEAVGPESMSSLFSTKYKAQPWQESLGYNFDKCKPHSGHSMLLLWVTPKRGVCGNGLGGNVQTKLPEPLDTASTYSVSFWVHVLESDGTLTGVQRYGTQFQAAPDDPTLYRIAPLENPAEVDRLRAAMNMPPLNVNASFRIKSN